MADDSLLCKVKHCAYNNIMTAGYYGYNDELTPQEIWDRASEEPIFENNFKFYSDVTQKQAFFKVGLSKIGTFGDFFEEMTTSFSGEFHWDNFNSKFLKSRGSKKNYALRWGKNISSLAQTLSTEDIKSHVIAFATVHDDYTDNDLEYMCEPYQIVGQESKTNKLLLIDASYLVSDITVNTHTQENIDFVINACRVAATSHYKNNEPASVKVNITVDFRAELDEMLEIGLADTIDVIIDSHNNKATAKVSKVEYDCLLERWNKLELGTIKTKLSDYF